MNVIEGAARGLARLRAGDHVCWSYTGTPELVAGLSRYIQAGLMRQHRVACFVRSDQLEEIRATALEAGCAEALERGSLILGVFEDAYLPDGGFDPDRRIDDYAAMVREALADGFDGLTVMGEPSPILLDPVAAERWPGYEVRADLLTSRLPLTALCAVDHDRLDRDALGILRSVHPSWLGDPRREPLFHLHATRSGGLSLHGEVDFVCSEQVVRIARDAACDVSEAALDLGGVRFIDVAGVRAVVESARALAETHPRVEIRNGGPTFRRIWELLDLDRLNDVGVVLA